MEDGCYFYLTLFKTAGHSKWRLNASKNSDTFDREIVGKQRVRVTERKVLRIDRTTLRVERVPPVAEAKPQ